jgi:hypothetical protein
METGKKPKGAQERAEAIRRQKAAESRRAEKIEAERRAVAWRRISWLESGRRSHGFPQGGPPGSGKRP